MRRYHQHYGESFRLEAPRGSGNWINLEQAADELSHRLVKLFLPQGRNGYRPVFGGEKQSQENPNWRDYPLFYEYFHGDNGAVLGASHQTGWTALVAKLIEELGEGNAGK